MSQTVLTISKYINHQNRQIFEELSKVYKIQLILDTSVTSWLVDNEKPIIRTPKDDLNIASFTHELLHIYIVHLGLTPPDDIYFKIIHIDILISINRAFLFDHIINVNTHKKTYPIFKKLGFKDEDFVQNNGLFFKRRDFRKIQVCKWLNIFSKFWISEFIGHAFAMKNDVIKAHEPINRKHLYMLSKLDKELYRIVYDFDSVWAKQTNLDCRHNYLDLSNNLYNWLKRNNFSKNKSRQ